MEMFNLDPDLDFVGFSWIVMTLGHRTRFEADPPLVHPVDFIGFILFIGFIVLMAYSSLFFQFKFD